jgi:hypothetical protein
MTVGSFAGRAGTARLSATEVGVLGCLLEKQRG